VSRLLPRSSRVLAKKDTPGPEARADDARRGRAGSALSDFVAGRRHSLTFLSVVHGSNDGQKGIGLIMLILIDVAPSHSPKARLVVTMIEVRS
jgi:hypothetical protein